VTNIGLSFSAVAQYFRPNIFMSKDAPFQALREYVKLILGTRKSNPKPGKIQGKNRVKLLKK
jgi:hypothetical protein